MKFLLIKDMNLFSTYHLSLFLISTVLYKNQADDSSEFASKNLVFGLENENPINTTNRNKIVLLLDNPILKFFNLVKLNKYLLISNQNLKINQTFKQNILFFPKIKKYI